MFNYQKHVVFSFFKKTPFFTRRVKTKTQYETIFLCSENSISLKLLHGKWHLLLGLANKHVYQVSECIEPRFHNLQWKVTQHLSPILTLSQLTNFRYFQTERVWRRQFQIWWKRQKVFQMGRKHCGKRRNCSLTSNFSFSHSVFERLVLQTL